MNKKKILLSPPHMSGKEIKFVNDAFETNWIAPVGPHIDLFEKKLSNIHHNRHVAALQSGTSAIHLALNLVGVNQDDIVLCQSFTFVGSVNPIRYLGAVPNFIDSEVETWNMCPNYLEKAIIKNLKFGKKPKAIIVVNLYGMPAKMLDIMKLSEKYDIPVIEDAAESLGSKINGKMTGCFGDYGILSFNGNKIITTSGGGALLSKDKEKIKRVKYLATQAKQNNFHHYEHTEIGYNYRISNISAAIGLGQLSVLNERIKKRREIHDFYFQILGEVDGISFLNEPQGFFSNRWLTTIIIDKLKFSNIDREKVRIELLKENIESRPLWKPMHMQPIYKNFSFYGADTCEKIFNNGLCLPSGSSLDEYDKERIRKILSNIFNLD
ncbi:MAG: DegT/DnrJ/EryC1/StrS family aminotransferase [Bacteroidota bacterium]|nr:DegT/DnrJ/EryC1/StrS family aminotransferase [Bacteroidota bacterium]